MSNTVQRMIDMLTCDETVRNYMWTIANGDPSEPEGEPSGYGTDELAYAVDLMYAGDVMFFPTSVMRRIAHSVTLREKADAISQEERGRLSDEDWVLIREGLMNSIPHTTVIPCGFCGEYVLAQEEAFTDHYRSARCWDE